jgi:sterol desaturase/sphingolipid hydroxylase (fatty acid hydroxylase superfamily)
MATMVNATATMMNSTAAGGIGDWMSYDFIVDPVSSWSSYQMAVFPVLFIIPAEILALVVDCILWYCGMGLPLLPIERYPKLGFAAYFYTYFNRFVNLPFVSFIIVRVVFASKAVVWDMNQMTVFNTVIAFVLVFSLSDLTYYTGHRIVHKVGFLYNFVHKHHHQESHPRRGWFDTCNAHPTDFFYTGIATCPVSCLWLFPAGTVHIVAIGAAMWSVMFVGALGHSRIDINIGVFNSRFHAGHHAMTFCNYAQNIELWDRLFGTYKELNMKGAKGVVPWKIE